jgi:hypothetical protein
VSRVPYVHRAATSRLGRLGATAACAGALALAGAGPAVAQTSTAAAPATAAGPGAVVDGADRTEIAQSLAEATTETGVCFGYTLRVLGATSGGTTEEQASSGGPDAAPGAGASCPKGTVAARITLIYTSESSESEDSASVSIDSTVPGLASYVVQGRLRDLELLDEGALLGDDDDLAVRNLAVALPLTLDDAVPAEDVAPAAATAPNGDRLTGSPGSDWMRAHLVTVLVGAVLLVGALIAIVIGWLGRRADGPRRPPPGDPLSTSPYTDSPSA